MADNDAHDLKQRFLSCDVFRLSQVMEEHNKEDAAANEEEVKPLKLEPTALSHEAKIRELLRNIVSPEVKLCSDGVKEFKNLLRGDLGGEFLFGYVRSSPKLSELMEAWKIRHKKPGLRHVLSVITAILKHPDGKYRPDDPARVPISRALDMFSKSIVEERLDDLYNELNSKEGKRQKAALLLVAAVVSRGSVLASEVANVFDFKMPGFPKLAEYGGRKGVLVKRKDSTRGAFIELAMSFLEVGQPGLLGWVLQQREMFSGLLRGLGSDDDENVVYVLSTLRDRVLVPESLVGPGLRSVLFGSVTLEQLANISGRDDGSLAAEVAHGILMMVCTDPVNGLMPDFKGKMSSFRGNTKRLIDLMKKLKPTKVKHHRELLLAVVGGRPLLASSYLDIFPYNLEDHSSPSWLSEASLAASLVSSVHADLSWRFLSFRDRQLPQLHTPEVQAILKCACPCAFSRAAISKGLQNKACTIQHGTLRFLLESLKMLDSFFNALVINELSSLKQEILNEVRNLLPDPQLMFNILNSLGNKYKKPANSRKQPCLPVNSRKKPCLPANSEMVSVNDNEKPMINAEEVDDILVGNVSASDNFLPLIRKNKRKRDQSEKSEPENDLLKISDLWNTDKCAFTLVGLEDAEVLFHCKLLEVFKISHCALHSIMEVSYDLFKIVPGDLLLLPSKLLQSLFPLLLEHIGWPSNLAFPRGTIPPIYKHLQSFVNLLLYSSNEDIRQQAYRLAQAALLSTGAFDGNPLDVRAWFLFLPGYGGKNVLGQNIELLQKLSHPVVSFLCNAVSTIGNHLLKYWDDIKCYACTLKGHKDGTISFSPLVLCMLEKCLQLLRSESGSFSLPEKTSISLYVCNTLKYLIETQVECQFLSSFVHEFLSKENVVHSSSASDTDSVTCEWRPLTDLSSFSAKVLRHELCNSFSAERFFSDVGMSFTRFLREVEKFPRNGSDKEVDAVSIAFYSSLLCTSPDQIIRNLPSILDMSENLYGLHHALITPLLFLDQNLLVSFFRLWPKVFADGLAMSGLRTKESQLSSPLEPSNTKLESAEFTSIACGAFMEQVPFHFLFPSVIIVGYHEHQSEITELLFDKLSKMEAEQLIPSLRLVLFWAHQIQLSYGDKPYVELHHFSQTCNGILEHILGCLLSLKAGTSCSIDISSSLVSQYLPVVAETIFSHPLVTMSFSSPLAYCSNVTEDFPQDSFEGFHSKLGHGVHEMNHHIFNMLCMTCDLLLTQSCGISVVPQNKDGISKIMKVFDKFVKQIFLLFREKFDLGIRTKDLMVLFPTLYGVISLLRYISPFELLELALWIFCRVKTKEFRTYKTSNISPICVGFFISAGAFTILDRSLQEPTNDEHFGVLFEGIYQKAVNFSVHYNLNSASLCLVEALNTVCRCKCSQDLIFLSMEMVRVISTTPIEIIGHCFRGTNAPKSRFLLHLIKLSPLHLALFGHLFLETLEDRSQCLADKDYLMLLPAALMYFSSAVAKFGKQYAQKFEIIPSLYARILLDGFLDCKSFASQSIFELECGAIFTLTSEELHKFFSCSLLGNTVLMLKSYISVRMETKDELLVLFDSICSNNSASKGLLDFNVKKIQSYPVNHFLNLINKVVAKVSLCQALLLPDDHQVRPPSGGNVDVCMKFVDMLVCTWKLIVKKVPSTSYVNSAKELNCYCLIKFLEVFILGSIADLAKKMSNALVQLDSLPFLEKIIRYSLLYRFGDSATFKLIRSTICSLSEGSLPVDLFLQLLIGHSQLASSLSNVNGSSDCQMAGLFSRPISSILGSLVISYGENSGSGKLNADVNQLESIKLLRKLFQLSSKKYVLSSESDTGINPRELCCLLLSSYGATMSEVDLEIYAFMQEIESTQGINGDCIGEFDYLWGIASIRIRKALEQEHSVSTKNDASEMEVDRRRNRFRENLLIDPKVCIATVLNFPYKRTLTEPFHVHEFHDDNAHNAQSNSEKLQQKQCYDPVFLLRFSVHCLSKEFLNPLEFSGLGLLAVALVSISSPDEGVRKLGYEVFMIFKALLEKWPKKKDVVALKLLLTYLQNGIKDPCLKIPSTHAVFVAEASLVLLDPSHAHYAPISNHLMKSPRMNMKSIPFFDKSSSSIDFKADRQWILRLLYTGLNLEDDALIFKKNSVLEILLSSYTSPLSDIKSKEMILQVVQKSVKQKIMAHHLVQDSALILWLSSILPSCLSLDSDKDVYFTKLMVTLLEVAKDAVSFRGNVEWLQMSGFEQLSDLSSCLFRILVSGSKLVQGNATLVTSILDVVMNAMQISLKRDIYQPHLTLSFGCLYKLYQVIGQSDDARYSACAEFGLKAVLMSAPPVSILRMDYEELSQFLVWAVSMALHLDSSEFPQSMDSHCCVADRGEACDDSFTSKLLRWLIASVILGKISPKRDDSSFVSGRTSMESLISIMQQCRSENRDTKNSSGSEELLAAVIFHLQLLLGTKCRVLSSVVAALSVLLISNTSCLKGSELNLFEDSRMSDLWSKIHCPPEANPSWRWSYSKPWADGSSKRSDLEHMEELHACEGLIIGISDVFEKKSLDTTESVRLTLRGIEESGIFQWEREQVCKRKRSESQTQSSKVRKGQ